ncbi:gliding motility-associated C-terminal domain-containing protein [Saprospiraceae bacterium]|nr:gliding motility-associated C-terminal domain-containing protein [Saprospiraceae bacterium]
MTIKTTILLILLTPTLWLSAQNLVPNANFEEFSACPINHSQIANAEGWLNPGPGSADYYHTCGVPDYHVPDNVLGYQFSSTGSAYGGITTILENSTFREYMQILLSSPTVAGHCYELTLVFSACDMGGDSNNLGLLLTNGAPTMMIGQSPQLIKTTVQDDQDLWHTINMQYVSPGGETHLTVGNFNDNASTDYVPGDGPTGTFAYYYIDSVAVQYLGDGSISEVDLGDDIEICDTDFPVTITSSLPDATNVWNTGEVGTSIEVNSPGIYFVESFYGCLSALDTIEVLIFDNPAIQVDDGAICEGDTYVVNLDETLGTYSWEDGSSGPEFVVTESGTYGVTLTHDCGDYTEDFHVDVYSILDIPDVADLQLCATELPYVIDFSDFDDGFNAFLWSNGLDEPSISINTDGAFSLQVSNECYSDFIDFQVQISQNLPSFINFADTTACIGQEVVINPNFSDVEYEWQDGSTTPFYLADGPGNYALTVTNFCGSEMFEFQINEATEVGFDLGEDVSICPGDSVLISSPNGQELQWNTGTTASEIWVTDAGALIAIAAGNCGLVSDTIEIIFDGTTPEIDMPDSLLVCAGDTISLAASAQTVGVDFTWNNGSEEAIINIFQAGTFIVSAENNCGMTTDSVVVSLGDFLPDPTLEDSYSICPGDSIELAILANGGSVEWSTGSLDSFVTLKVEGIYTVSLTNSCATKYDNFAINWKAELGNLDLGEDVGICEGTEELIEAAGFDGSYLWSDNSSEESLLIDQAGIYTLQISGECNEIYDTIEIFDLGNIPEIDLGSDVQFCEGDSVIIDIGAAIVDDILWNTSSTENMITVFTAGSYFVVGSNICGVSSDTIVVTLNDQVPTIDLGADQEICPGETVTLDIGNVVGIIEWNTGEDGSSIEVSEAGVYIVNLSSSCGSAEDSVLVDVLEAAPEVDLGVDQVLCFGESLDFDLTVGDATTILWNNGVETAENSFNQSALIWVALSNACGTDGDSIILQVIPEVSEVDLGADVSLCDESNYMISPFIFDFNVEVEWNTGEMTDGIVVTETGEYWLEVSNACFAESDTILVTFGVAPMDFDLGENDTICSGENILLEEDQGMGFEYSWQDNSSNTAILATESGSYELVISNDCGTVSDEIDILVIPTEEIDVSLDENYLLCDDVPLEIDLSGIVADFIEWNDGSDELFRILTNPGSYEITFNNICADTLISFLFEHEDCSEDGAVFIPNSFTPDGDGVNDLFQIFISENWLTPEVKVSIYNRWGEQMFYSEDVGFLWDGTFKGGTLNAGVYAYYIELEVEVDGVRKLIQKAGDISIVK